MSVAGRLLGLSVSLAVHGLAALAVPGPAGRERSLAVLVVELGGEVPAREAVGRAPGPPDRPGAAGGTRRPRGKARGESPSAPGPPAPPARPRPEPATVPAPVGDDLPRHEEAAPPPAPVRAGAPGEPWPSASSPAPAIAEAPADAYHAGAGPSSPQAGEAGQGPPNGGVPSPAGGGARAGHAAGGDGPAGGEAQALLGAPAGGGAGTSPLALALPGGDAAPPEGFGPYLAGLRARIQESLSYPTAARRRGLAGTVQLEIELRPTGEVVSVVVRLSSSHAVLDQAALEAVRGLRPLPFPPGLPRRSLRVRLPIVFALR